MHDPSSDHAALGPMGDVCCAFAGGTLAMVDERDLGAFR